MRIDEKKRNLYLHDVVTSASIKDILEKMDDIIYFDNDLDYNLKEYERPPIVLDISTPGGSCYAGLSLIHTIRNSPTPIIGIASGVCASMGIPILASCHRREASKHATFMIHDVAHGSFGKIPEVEENLKNAKNLRKFIFNIIKDTTNIKQKFLDKIVTEKTDYYFYANEAKKLGLIDAITL